jgi:hypothetical protein
MGFAVRPVGEVLVDALLGEGWNAGRLRARIESRARPP